MDVWPRSTLDNLQFFFWRLPFSQPPMQSLRLYPMRFFNPFLPGTVEHLSYISHVIEMWIFEYPVQAISDLMLGFF
jgi:hypothetical protein